jgi:hypothetical protein
VSSLCRGHANLLCIVPIFSYASPKGAIVIAQNWSWQMEILILCGPRVRGARCHVVRSPPPTRSHQLPTASLFHTHPPHSVMLSRDSCVFLVLHYKQSIHSSPPSLHTTRLSNSPRTEHGQIPLSSRMPDFVLSLLVSSSLAGPKTPMSNSSTD